MDSLLRFFDGRLAGRVAARIAERHTSQDAARCARISLSRRLGGFDPAKAGLDEFVNALISFEIKRAHCARPSPLSLSNDDGDGIEVPVLSDGWLPASEAFEDLVELTFATATHPVQTLAFILCNLLEYRPAELLDELGSSSLGELAALAQEGLQGSFSRSPGPGGWRRGLRGCVSSWANHKTTAKAVWIWSAGSATGRWWS
jgi:hypothetical protein